MTEKLCVPEAALVLQAAQGLCPPRMQAIIGPTQAHSTDASTKNTLPLSLS